MPVSTTQQLLPWQVLTVSADKHSAGSVRRKSISGPEVNYPAQAVVDGAPAVIGPFPTVRLYEIVSDTGLLTYAFSDSDSEGAGLIVLSQYPVVRLTADGAIPVARSLVVLAKEASAIAATLAAPTLDQDGLPILITSATNKAHQVNATGLIQTADAEGPLNSLTFTAYRGASANLIALDGFWHVLALHQVTAG